MAIKSRSGFELMQRMGIIDETARPCPRFSPEAMLVNFVPVVSPPRPQPNVLRVREGDPPPDRGDTRPWPLVEDS
jgi:hypothetical protein